MRKLPAAAQEERRRQVIGLRQRGLTYGEIAEQVGLTPDRGDRHLQALRGRGPEGLVSQPRGRKPDEQRLLEAAQEAEVQQLIRRHTPDELGLPFALWSRAAVGVLVRAALRGRVGGAHGGQVPGALGFHAQKPLRRAYEQDPAAVRRWLRREYPAIVARAGKPGVSSSGVTRPACARTTCAAAATRRAAGHRWSGSATGGPPEPDLGSDQPWRAALDGCSTARSTLRLIRFLERLIREARRKVFLILDRLRVHRARLLRDWLAGHSADRGVLPAGLQSRPEPG